MAVTTEAKILGYDGTPILNLNGMQAVTLSVKITPTAPATLKVGDQVRFSLDADEHPSSATYFLRRIDYNTALTIPLQATDIQQDGTATITLKAYVSGGKGDKAWFSGFYDTRVGGGNVVSTPFQATPISIANSAMYDAATYAGFRPQPSVTVPDKTVPSDTNPNGFQVKFNYASDIISGTKFNDTHYYARFYFSNSVSGAMGDGIAGFNAKTIGNLRIYKDGDFTTGMAPQFVDSASSGFYLISDANGEFSLDIFADQEEVFAGLFTATPATHLRLGYVVALDPTISSADVVAPNNFPDTVAVGITSFSCGVVRDPLFTLGGMLYVFCDNKLESANQITGDPGQFNGPDNMLITNISIQDVKAVKEADFTVGVTKFVYRNPAGVISHSSDAGIVVNDNNSGGVTPPILPPNQNGTNEGLAAPTFPSVAAHPDVIEPSDCVYGLQVLADWSGNTIAGGVVAGASIVVTLYINGYDAGTSTWDPKTVASASVVISDPDIARKATTVTFPYEDVAGYDTSEGTGAVSTIMAQYTITDAGGIAHTSPTTAAINFVSADVGGTD